ncbi:hypothetical protein K504DRAFT_420031 [Pleomassaria siparia CBS 279.74]|uniref:Rhodopsin domain-containing protein n=1 Tax=Pleomassaria siparia CBS 279.74 TaxID=1314801 RepID=A0A6G1KP38_9PLEO|nr:hypothetical protein K504DRAFT_420031 [Pleomassaria siparia CBS 279.74]
MSPDQIHALILESPALMPPPGVTPDFVNPPNLRNDPLTISLLVISTIVVWSRLYTKARIVKKLVLEDYALLLAWVVYLGAFHTYVYKIHMLPTGVHQWNLEIKDLIRSLKLFHYAEIMYALSIVPLKAAIILQCLRVFVPPGVRDLTFWACCLLLVANTVFYSAVIFIEAFSCVPMEAIWDITIEGKCINRLSLHYISAAFNSASDICVLILPQRAIWGLETMKTKRKWGLSALFFLGAFACVSSIVRLYYTVLLYRSHDVSYHTGQMGIWTEPELTCGFVAASVPVFPRLFQHSRNQTPFAQIGAAFRKLFGKDLDMSGKQLAHGGDLQAGAPPRKFVSDVDFHELVRETDGTEKTMGSGESDALQEDGVTVAVRRGV